MATEVILNQHALSDVSMVEIITEDEKSYTFETASEVGVEEVIDAGDEQTLKIKGKLYANRAAKDTLLGHNLTFTDNLMCPELLELFQGGTLTPGESGKFTYTPPAIGTKATKKKFTTNIYTAEVSTDGDTGKYMKVSYSSCEGTNTSFEFKDGEYYTNKYTVKSRPPKKTAPYVIDFVDTLPTIAQA